MNDDVERAARSRAVERARAVEMRKFFAICKPYGFSDLERREYASQMLGREISSFAQLDRRELHELTTGLRGAAFIFVILNQRPRATGRAAARAQRAQQPASPE